MAPTVDDRIAGTVRSNPRRAAVGPQSRCPRPDSRPCFQHSSDKRQDGLLTILIPASLSEEASLGGSWDGSPRPHRSYQFPR
jgi:hypothetical protein